MNVYELIQRLSRYPADTPVTVELMCLATGPTPGVATIVYDDEQGDIVGVSAP